MRILGGKQVFGDLIRSLQRVNQKLQAPETKRLTPAPINPASFKAKLCSLSQPLRQKLPWLSILAEGTAITPDIMAVIWQIPVEEAIASLEYFAAENLVVAESRNVCRYYLSSHIRALTFHLLTSAQASSPDLLRLNIPWPTAHQWFLNQVFETNPTLEQNIAAYLSEHLFWHLTQANWSDRIHSILEKHAILTSPAWMSQLQPLDGSSAVPLLKAAKDAANTQFSQDSDQRMRMHCRYALLSAKQHLEVQSIPTTWAKHLIATGYWHPSQGLRYLQSHADPERRAEIIQEFSSVFPQDKIAPLLNLASTLSSDSARATALRGLYPRLELRQKKLVLGLIGTMKSDFYQSLSISVFAPYLPLPLMGKTLALIKEMTDESAQAHALTYLIPHLTRPLVKQALDWVYAMAPLPRLTVLIAMTTVLPELQSELADIFLTELDIYEQAETWGQIIAVSPSLAERLPDWFASVSDESEWVGLIQDCASNCSQDQLEMLWQQALSICEEQNRAQAIAGLLPVLNTHQLRAVMDQVRRCERDEAKAVILSQLGPYLNPCDYPNFYQAMLEMDDLDLKTEVFIHYCQYDSTPISEAVAMIELIADSRTKLQRQVNLVGDYPAWGCSILASLVTIADERLRASLLTQVFSDLSSVEQKKALQLVITLKDHAVRAWALNSLAGKLSPEQLWQGTQDILKQNYDRIQFENTAKKIHRYLLETPTGIQSCSSDIDSMSKELSRLVPHPTPSQPIQTQQIFQTILDTPDSFYRARLMGLFLHEVEWEKMKTQNLIKILEILLGGHPQLMLQHLPDVCMGIQSPVRHLILSELMELCQSLANKKPPTQNKTHTYNTDALQEPTQRTV